MKIHVGCDHAAFEEKENLKAFLKDLGHEVIDEGPSSGDRVNYPEYAIKVSKKVSQGNEDNIRGVLLCGSGIGVSMVANRFSGIRAALCRTEEDAKLSREHNFANVLCLGARVTPYEKIEKIVKTWLETNFEGGRHQERIDLFTALGEKGE